MHLDSNKLVKDGKNQEMDDLLQYLGVSEFNGVRRTQI